MSDWESYLKNNSEKFVSELIEFVNIPSVSADLSYKEDVRKGLDCAPKSFLDLLNGGNFGKMLVRL